jgi:nitroreductase
VEFRDVLRRRKMVRTFLDRPVDAHAIERILDVGRRGPSAGFSQGFAFLVSQGKDEVGRFWEAVSSDEAQWPDEGMRGAPVIVVPMAGKRVYLDRYAEDDKGWTDRDQARWPVPYWTVDTSFASLLILLAAVDEGLGALFFGLDQGGYDRLKAEFGVPEGWDPIGVIAIGHPAPVDPARSSAHTRPRKPIEEVVHRGRW